MSDNIYPFQHSPENLPGGESMLDRMMRAVRESRLIQAGIVEASQEQEELHKHQIRIVNGMNYAIRWCTVPGCMQSWRMFVGADYPEEFPGGWVPIEEPGLQDED